MDFWSADRKQQQAPPPSGITNKKETFIQKFPCLYICTENPDPPSGWTWIREQEKITKHIETQANDND